MYETLHFQSGDVCNIEFEDNTFDVVINFFLFHIVETPVKLCTELERVLKPDGILIMADLRRQWLGMFEPEMKAAYTTEEARDLIAKSNLRKGELRETFWGWEYVAG